MITPLHIFEQTNDGLEIILKYYPQAEENVRRKSAKFRVRTVEQDPTPSAVLRHYNGVWRVTDFGSGEKSMDAIGVVMKEENCDFPTAMKLIATNFNIVDSEGNEAPKIRATYKKRPSLPDEEEGKTYFEIKEDFTLRELQSLFSINTWRYLSKQKYVASDVQGDELAIKNANAILAKFRLKSLASYTFIKDGFAVTFGSNDQYPIFMWDEAGDFKKIYKPLDPKNRFFSVGNKPKDYAFGLSQAEERLENLRKNDTPGDVAEGEEEPETGSRQTRLPELILCSGGSDALNLAAFGYSPIWFNSETVSPKSVPFFKLSQMAERVYNLGDIDDTGIKAMHELALEHLDLFTIYLPEQLRTDRDKKGKRCKDLRDFLNVFAYQDLKNLMAVALPYRFWDEEPKRDRKGNVIKKFGRILKEYKPNNRRLYNFLYRSGFGKLPMPNTKEGEVLIQRIGNVVHQIDYKQIRRFIENFLESRFFGEDLFNTFYRSEQIGNSSLENIKSIQLEFKDFGKDYQYLFFENEVWKVTAKGSEILPTTQSDRIVWSDKVIPHRVKKLDPMFEIKKDENGHFSINIKNKSCLFFRYLINTSRVFWKKELEELLPTRDAVYQANYLAEHKWSVDGELLSPEERQEQQQHLVNKMASIGYLLHKYKDPATAYCIWAMDYNMQNSGQSYGGTGKSLAYDPLKWIRRQDYHNGRNDKLTENQFIFGRVTEHTDYVFIDDAWEFFNFRFFFSVITGSMECMSKGVDAWVLPNDKSPKLCITSNFPPRDTDSATQRRLWFTTFSDYYHKNPNGEYKEERDPKSEFGKSMFTEFTADEWNLCLNFYAQCIQVWLQFGKVDPPGEIVKENTYRNKVGANFMAWADVFFSPETDRLNRFVQRNFAYENYKRDYDPKITPQGFKDKLRFWAMYNGYTVDPAELKNKQGRIVRKVFKQEFRQGQWVQSEKTETVEHIYIQTADTALTNNGLLQVHAEGFNHLNDTKEEIGF